LAGVIASASKLQSAGFPPEMCDASAARSASGVFASTIGE
jgi:hypothetical protein